MTQYDVPPSLDHDFLRYMGVKSEAQRTIQSHYLTYFAPCTHVLDLGCGDGDFVALLAERGIDAVGVDADEKALQSAREQGLSVVQSDVFDYLASAPDASFDGIFCAHLVEHLPYERVYELVQQIHRLLQPGGIALLATPDVRSIFSHLEMFYLHFDHVSFYHPRLLCFFLEHAGFVDALFEVNPETASPLLPGVNRVAAQVQPAYIHPYPPLDISMEGLLDYAQEIPPQGSNPLQRFSYRLKSRLTRWLVQPLIYQLARQNHKVMQETMTYVSAYLENFAAHVSNSVTPYMNELRGDVHTLATEVRSLNTPFECYALAYKPPRTKGESPQESRD